MPEIFLWTNPINSGIVFASGLAVYLLLEVLEYTVLGLAAQVATYLLLAALAFTGAKLVQVKFLSGAPLDPSRANWPLANFSFPRDTIHTAVDSVVDALNDALVSVKEIFYVQDMVVTAQAAGAAFVASYVFSWIGFNTAVFTAFFLLFTIPLIYAKFHTQIDPVLAKAKAQVDALVAMIPRGKKKTE